MSLCRPTLIDNKNIIIEKIGFIKKSVVKMTALKDLVFQKFSRLTVIGRAQNTPGGQAKWFCLCECGKVTTVVGSKLINGHTRSCGCLMMEINSKKWQLDTTAREYNIWVLMKQRCFNNKNKSYKYYGGRGISVCQRWTHEIYGYSNFINDVGFSPGIDYSLERINYDDDYCPENCIWIKKSHQNLNTRRCKIHGINIVKQIHKLINDGESILDISKELNVPIEWVQSLYEHKIKYKL